MPDKKLRHYVAYCNSVVLPSSRSFYYSAHRANSKANLSDAREAYKKEHGYYIEFVWSKLLDW